MEFLLTYKLSTTSPQKAALLRDRAADWLNEDPEVTVTSSSSSQVTRSFEVIGVDTSNKKPFKERTEAKDEEEAVVNVVNADKAKVVAEVRAA